MPTPPENRFLRLAVAQKMLTKEQCKACLGFQVQKQKDGSKIPIWDCAVLQSMLAQDDAEKLQGQAGDLKVEKLGEFRILRKLGEGGMGSVWMAVGPDRERVAIKLLSPELAKQRQFLTRFFREAQAAIKLQHDNIVRGIDVGEDAGYYYFAMEYISGKSVRDILDEQGPIPPERATDIILQTATGLAFAHEHGIVHRDIKPDNIMLTREGVAKLADLGLARQMDSEMTQLTRTGTAMGTPYYMAPEQVRDAKRADARSDIYALGGTWYHMLAGHVPFEGETPLEIWQKHLKEPVRPLSGIRTDVPRSVSLVIERMLAKEPDNRVQSAAELCDLIREKCLGDRDITKELGMAERKVKESLWDMKVAVGNRVERRRFSISEVRARIRKGQITRETPARRSGAHGEYQPAGAFRELEREFPRDYAVHVDMGARTQPSSRSELHNLVTHFDESKRAYGRKRALHKLVPWLIKLGVLAAIAVVVYLLWPQISGIISGLTGGAAEAP